MEDKVMMLYQTVFDEDNQVKLCRREACAKLITALQEEYPDGDFGDKNTGMMKCKNIISYVKQRNSDIE